MVRRCPEGFFVSTSLVKNVNIFIEIDRKLFKAVFREFKKLRKAFLLIVVCLNAQNVITEVSVMKISANVFALQEMIIQNKNNFVLIFEQVHLH